MKKRGKKIFDLNRMRSYLICDFVVLGYNNTNKIHTLIQKKWMLTVTVCMLYVVYKIHIYDILWDRSIDCCMLIYFFVRNSLCSNLALIHFNKIFAQAHILRINEQANERASWSHTDEYINKWVERDEMKWQWSGLRNANIMLG